MKYKIILILFAGICGFAPVPKDTAWQIVEGLTTEVGPRLAGTDAEARARTWAVETLKQLGFANVHIETYDMPVWVRGAETAEVTAPFKQNLVLTALGNSGATPEAGIELPVIGFNSLDELRDIPDSEVRGKIVYVSHNMRATQDGSSYGQYGPTRWQGPAIAARKGAAAFLMRSLGTNNARSPHTGVTRFPAGVTPIPAAALAIPDAENLQRMLARANGGLSIKLVLTPRQIGTRQSGNVIAEVPGTTTDTGIIVIGGHLDSWDMGTGAIDDGAGLAITTAAAKRILDGPRPPRTIRVVWWGSEEVGGFGADAYFEAHKNEKTVFAAESDFGADRIWAFSLKLPESARGLANRLKRLMSEVGVLFQEGMPEGGADVGKLIEHGAWVADLKQDGTHYFDLHHTPDDTLDKIDPEALAQNVDVWEILLRALAFAPEDLSPIANSPAVK